VGASSASDCVALQDRPVKGAPCGRVATAMAQASPRGCPRHAVAALDGIASVRVDWADSKGLNQWERTALELAEERSTLGSGTSA